MELLKFSCILGKYNTLQQNLEGYDSPEKILIKHKKKIEWYNCRDKKKKKKLVETFF